MLVKLGAEVNAKDDVRGWGMSVLDERERERVYGRRRERKRIERGRRIHLFYM